jgi:hypothetical protein
MDFPPDLLATFNGVKDFVLALDGVTGMDIGVRDEEAPDADDLVLRIFVRDLSQASTTFPAFQGQTTLVVSDLIALPFGLPPEFGDLPLILIQREFSPDQLPDTTRYRPVIGGGSTTPGRLVASGGVPSGTLGAVVRGQDGQAVFGLSNFHVLAVDPNRSVGDEIRQPSPTILGSLPGDRVGELVDWAFPETTVTGDMDAAICSIEPEARAEIVDIGRAVGRANPQVGMLVQKRGKQTGLTFGYISGGGDYWINYPGFGARKMVDQFQVHVDFPSSVEWSAQGDSGSLVVDFNGRAVGLHFGSDHQADPVIPVGVATPVDRVEAALGITFNWPLPSIFGTDPDTALANAEATITGEGFLLASDVVVNGESIGFQVISDTEISAQFPGGQGSADLTVEAPGGTSATFKVAL